ncbi:MAG: hypothetical protein JNK61_04565 [Bacteroidia bacterium]|nr:hypothetical protein [Bacteroidia bacterium]
MQNILRILILCIGISVIACQERNIPEPKAVAVFTTPDSVKTLYREITSDTIIKNIYSGSTTDYRIMNMWRISNGATLTIEAGVNLQVVQNGGIFVSDGAALKILGTATNPVNITGQSKTKGFWNGIIFENTSNPSNELNHVVIEYAGGNTTSNMFYSAALALVNAHVQLNNASIRNNKIYGVSFDSTSVLNLESCTITANDSNPVLATHVNFMLHATNCNLLGNGNDKILVRSIANVTGNLNQQITYTDLPYLITGTARYASALTLAPNTRLIMGKLSSFYFNNDAGNAAIIGSGTFTQPIRIEGEKPDSGYWQGIVMHAGGQVQLNYCRIVGAGTAADFGYQGSGAALMVSGGQPGNLLVENCTIENAFFNGIIIDTAAVNYNSNIETINTFINIKNLPVVYY